ncbi:uncharacterized protein LOC115742989 [Rhodamnia argentea]|uniref:Uncharacterized protein LOC115742989 n=1 Tax=Rhodamnia argentea TaxID=178133 RepID=A0A8B8PFH0_9MYRT|nr:uncharacterized protein LOC115742989 [Rhodamnia argentea]
MAISPPPPSSSSSSSNKSTIRATIAMADAASASSLCAIFLIALILVASDRESSDANGIGTGDRNDRPYSLRGNQLLVRPCDEIYVVGEGETLHSISDKCGDPFIVERNPHIQDPDDVFPGLVIKITPTKKTRKLLMS